MIVRNISNEIICNYKKECRRYSANSKISDCPRCKNNKWKDPQKTKVDYYKPKYNVMPIVITIIFIIIICCMGV